jgi:hypothetical protein
MSDLDRGQLFALRTGVGGANISTSLQSHAVQTALCDVV